MRKVTHQFSPNIQYTLEKVCDKMKNLPTLKKTTVMKCGETYTIQTIQLQV